VLRLIIEIIIEKSIKYNKIQKICRKDDQKKFQRNFVKNWKKYVNSYKKDERNPFKDDFINAMRIFVDETYFNNKEYFKEYSIHKIPLKKKLEIMNDYLDEGNFSEPALKYREELYKNKKKPKYKITPKYIKNLLKPILTRNNKFSWEKANYIQQTEEGLFSATFDKEFVKLLQKSKVNKNEIINYAYQTTGWFTETKTKMKRFIHEETGISLS